MKHLLLVASLLVLMPFFHTKVIACDKNIGYHIALGDLNLLNRTAQHEIAKCGKIITLNIPWSKSNNGQEYKKIVRHLKAHNPELTILVYTWFNRWFHTNRIGTTVLGDLSKKNNFLIHDKNGNILSRKAGHILFPDISSREYQYWAISRIKKFIYESGSDGVFLDNFYARPRGVRLHNCLEYNQKGCQEYEVSIKQFLASLRKEIIGKKIYFNGLFSNIKSQESLLKYTDGAMIEYFGLHPESNSDFDDNSMNYYRNITSHWKNKTFLVFGRSKYRNTSLKVSIRDGLYSYAKYLVHMPLNNTTYKYHSSFQVPAHKGATGGLFLLEEQKHSLGKRTGKNIVHGCIRAQEFNNGIVSYCDARSKTGGTLKLKQEYLSAHNKKVHEIFLLPGQAKIFFKRLN